MGKDFLKRAVSLAFILNFLYTLTMFTGIIEELGTLIKVTNSDITISAKTVLEGTRLGDSISCNGVCLTVTAITSNTFTASVMAETFSKTTLGALTPSSAINLERAATLNSRLGGHIVLGHVDNTGIIKSVKSDGVSVWYKIAATSAILRYIAPKGSVALDGVSLTVVDVSDSQKVFTVSTIPHTRATTTLGTKKVGDAVNIECDVISRYIEHFITAGESGDASDIDNKLLGFLA